MFLAWDLGKIQNSNHDYVVSTPVLNTDFQVLFRLSFITNYSSKLYLDTHK